MNRTNSHLVSDRVNRLVRKPDAGKRPVRFDERGVETEHQPPRHSSTLLIFFGHAKAELTPSSLDTDFLTPICSRSGKLGAPCRFHQGGVGVTRNLKFIPSDRAR